MLYAGYRPLVYSTWMKGNERQSKGGLGTGLTVPSGQLNSIKRSSSLSGEREGKELSSSAKGTYRKWNDHPPCRSTETSGPANVTRTRGAIHKDEDQSGHLLPIQDLNILVHPVHLLMKQRETQQREAVSGLVLT